jgi:CelD/BcsL family acetyltransferase involved in cellulose biosynthesis
MALRDVLRRPPSRFQVFLGRHLPGTVDWATSLDARLVHADASPVLQIAEPDWDAVLASFGTGLRREIRYDTRRIAREHDVRYRLCTDPEELDRDLDALFELHAAQWGPGSSFIGHEAFHRAFAAIALERGWLRLWTLEVDGQPRAVKLNFRFAGAEYSYQGGRDPAWRGPSLGLVNLANAMKAAVEEGAREYRFLRGGERYKFRFPVTPGSVVTVTRGSGMLGRAAVSTGLALDDTRLARNASRRIGRRLTG